MAQARKKNPGRLSKAETLAAQNRIIQAVWAVFDAFGIPSPPPQHVDGSEFSPAEAEATSQRYWAELEDAKAGLLENPPNPALFHACLAQYGPFALALVLLDAEVLAAMQQWWGQIKWGPPSPERAHLTGVLAPIGTLLSRRVSGRGGSLTPAQKDAEKERDAGNKRKYQYDARLRAAIVRLTGAPQTDLDAALQSRSASTRTAAKHVLRQRNKAGR